MVTATSLFSDGDLAPAEQIIRAFLLQHGNHPEAMRLLARIGMARDVLDDAEMLLEAVLVLAPDHRAARYDYAQTPAQAAQIRQAARADRAAAGARAGNNPDYRALAATAAVGLGEHDKAIALYRDMLADVPDIAGRASLARPCAEDGRPGSGSDRGLSRGRGGAARFRRRLLEPGEPQDLPLHR